VIGYFIKLDGDGKSNKNSSSTNRYNFCDYTHLMDVFLGFISISDILGDRAESVGGDTIDEVSTGVPIESITGYASKEETKIEYLAITIKPRAGSTQIDLAKCSLNSII
jgi:hypothetical protein